MLAYIITPDQSKYCNTQVLNNSFLKPGSTVCYKAEIASNQKRNFKDLVFGTENFNKLVQATNSDTIKNCKTYFLGTDRYGRDLLSRLIIGMRYTLLISILSVIFALLLGSFLGSIAGYYSGFIDKFISFNIGVFWALPSILVSFIILMAIGKTITALFLSIGLTMWADVARLVRGQVLSIKEQYYVQASKALGYSDGRIIFSQILPNAIGPIMVSCSSNFALAVLLESGLSFLGLGLQAPIPTIGNILQDQYVQAFNGEFLQSLIPAIVLVLLILSFQVLANHLRDRFDVKLIKG